MVRKALLAAVLVLGAAGAARADGEPYGFIWGGRTFLSSPTDERPKNALQATAAGEDAPASRFLIAPFYGRDDAFHAYGGTLAFASRLGEKPFSARVDLFGVNPDGPIDTRFSVNGNLKLTLWEPEEVNLPVVSAVVNYVNTESLFHRWDALLAADQRLSDQLYLTANLGWGHLDAPGIEDSGFVPGFGLTFVGGPRWSLSADYVVDNAVDNEDLWSASLLYALTPSTVVKLTGGKHGRFFAHFIWTMDR